MSDGSVILSPEMKARLQECYTYGNQKMSLGDHDYATEMFIQCLLGDPSNIIYIQAFILNLRRKYNDNKKGNSLAFLKSTTIKSAIKTASARKNWENVLKNGAEMLKINPWDAGTFAAMGHACLEMGLPFAGLAYYKQAIESNPNDVETNRVSARALAEIQEYDQALACWNRVLKIKPNDEEARKAIGDLYVEKTIKKGKYESGDVQKSKISTAQYRENVQNIDYEEKAQLSPEEQFEKDVKKSPNEVTLYLDRADILFQANRIKEAEEVIQRLIQVKDQPEFRLKLVEIQRRRLLDEVAKIKSDYESSKSPDAKEKFKAAFHEKKNDLEQITIQMYMMRVEQSPGNSTYHFDLGNYYFSQGKYKEAITEFQAAKPDISIQGKCLLALGQCFQQIKQYKLAMTHYQQAIQTISEDGESKKKSLYLATRLAYGLQDYTMADDYASQLAAIDFSYKDIGELLDKIAEKRKN
ncbi:MAG: tetratricopeptide repeat protein [Planctomycetaceae bacterium]|nr:tetratricopeptide repeat protein [Planctomycetaceae bacterium]